MKFVLYSILIVVLAVGFVYMSFILFFKDGNDSFYYGYINTVPIKIEVADTEEERNKGLGGREEIPNNEAMLFVFPESGLYGIWMKDMKFGIDILWLDESLKVLYIQKSVFPDTYPKVFSAKIPSQYILEVREGFADEYRVSIGDALSIFSYTPKLFTDKPFLTF